jgi:NAD(P)-dependent dehydrogenase (short-subunit alcohol dehydrogenase family)
MSLNGQTVIVVGGGSGIGRAVASAASEAGARVVLAGRRAAALAASAATMPGPVGTEVLDLADERQVAAFFDRVGPFHHLVCTASQGAAGRVTALEAPAVAQAFGAKLWGPLFLAKHGAQHVARDGSFTFFSGIRADRPAPGASVTSLVNGGLEAFARALAVELAPVRVNVLSPGIVDSGAFWDRLGADSRDRLFADFSRRAPAGRVGRVEEQAQTVLHCLVNPFLTGAVLPVDGGARLV